ncbi:EAL domain-containing protein [Calidifontibacillus oryziterrae]|uniref:EAL domain-containing protein n=1 Tax=Calidifontibacillus oryziterrae TaxID=1191699 RepID=UPI0002D29CFB|nr:EAL domain-containing protein [Calidifontibacillus oryziterrae]
MQRHELSMIIEQQLFEHYCQPIYDLNNQLPNGAEMLLRARFATPDIIFNEAKKADCLYELDTLSIIKALEIQQSYRDRLFFLNVFPSTLKNPLFPEFLEYTVRDLPLIREKIVFEINEGESVFDLSLLRDRINWLKEIGFQVALDDVGKGALSLTNMIELNVNFIKLDRYFSNHLHLSTKKQNMISAILHYCHANHIKVILEGIETEEELLTANSLGVDMGQGYYLGKPEKTNLQHNSF